jgi:nitrogen regulatory protein P-II 1
MMRITALLHPNRIGEIVHALAAAGHRRFSVVHAQGLLQAVSTREQTYSVELGELITQQIQLDVYCVDDELPTVVDLIQRHGKTGQATSGWLFASRIDHAYAIDSN